MSKFLDVAGLGSLVAACFVVALPLGLAATGAACLLVSWRSQK